MKRIIIVVLLCGLASCASKSEPVSSGWSAPVNGLQFQISAASQVVHRKDKNTRLDVTCTVTNTGSTATGIVRFARLYLVDSAGATNRCARREDVASMVRSRPVIASGQATSFSQDGTTTIGPGSYGLFAVWDGDNQLQSPSIQIKIK